MRVCTVEKAEYSVTLCTLCPTSDSEPGGKIDFRTRSMKPTCVIVIMQIAPPHPLLHWDL